MSLYYADDTEDSFEDFLEWRRFKREAARGAKHGGAAAAPAGQAPRIEEARVTAPAAVVASASRAAPAPAAAAAPANKGKEEETVAVRSAPTATTTTSTSTFVAVPSSSAPVAVPGAASAPAKVPVPVETGAPTPVSSAGERWVAELAAANDKGKKDLRNAVLEETRAVLKAGKYSNDVGATVELDTVGASSNRVVFSGDEKTSGFPAPYNTTAHFVKADAIETALFLIEKKGVNPLVVIPADPKNVGGGFPGSSSLEEQFYRRTTGLLAVEDGDFKYDIPAHGAVYLPNVQVFRDPEPRTGYQFLRSTRKVAFLLASSVEKPKYEAKGRSYVLDAEAQQALEAKVNTILSAGLAKGHDAIVITAFGCGYNQTPPQCVAAVFRNALTGKFSNTYKHVTFAIIDDENCGKAHNPQGNLVSFQQEFLSVTKTAAKGKCCSK